MWRGVTLAYGLVFLVVGIAGFVPGLVAPPADPDAVAVDGMHGQLFGMFPVNWLHNLVHLAFALWGIAAYVAGPLPSRTYLRAVAIVYAALVVFGVIPGLDTLFGLVPLYGHDVWLHALLALGAGIAGFLVPDRNAAAGTRQYTA